MSKRSTRAMLAWLVVAVTIAPGVATAGPSGGSASAASSLPNANAIHPESREAEDTALQDVNRRSDCSAAKSPDDTSPPCSPSADTPTNNAVTPEAPSDPRNAEPPR